MSGGTPPLHTHNHHVTVAVRDPHSSAGPRHATVSPVASSGHPVVALACLRCTSVAVTPRPLCTSTLRSYFPSSTLTRHLSRHDVSYYYSFRSYCSLLSSRCRGSSVTIVIKLKVGRQMNPGLSPGRRKTFPLPQSVQPGSRRHPASYPMSTTSTLGQSDRAVKLTSRFHFVPKLKIVELYLHTIIFFYEGTR
jgi:hypothetical protein